MRAGRARKLIGRVAVALLAAMALAALLPAAASALTVRGSVKQVHVTDAAPGEPLRLLTRKGKRVDTKFAGSLGGSL